MFFAETLATVRFPLTVHILFLAELLTAEQMQINMLLIGSSLHISGVRYYHAQILITVTMVIYRDIIKSSGIEILMLDIHIETADLGVEHTLGDFQFGILLIYGVYEGIKILGGTWHGDILEIERHARQQYGKDHDRTHNPEERNA